jgi:peptidylprolyl isomerase domain and WD repeat-containing protein 1
LFANITSDATDISISAIREAAIYSDISNHSRSNPSGPNPSTQPADTRFSIMEDPCIFATAYKSDRFFIFSRREPDEDISSNEKGVVISRSRDVMNEQVVNPILNVSAPRNNQQSSNWNDRVVLHTTLGDIVILVFGRDCPRAAENFITHCQNHYYDNVKFHRVIKNFMIQTGDPLGDGTGGESIWHEPFENEIVPHLRHDQGGVVSMANAGPNTNGSQFFITTAPAPWLDGKHTVFGKVLSGMEVAHTIEEVRVDKNHMPLHPVKIISVEVRKAS